ncbi:CinA family protein [Pararhodospirillum oryzae]|uniref:Competence damage-inducible protein A n=1 Tax=Pararhodospirillum oryzae TaxID=478448 RepID=A0A512HB82_9PROT|nr:CinA family protein [Pararhodospirillum oryzae]GEO82717.1 competence damage-inducible protein A [Pararhodospirillum oryzae]
MPPAPSVPFPRDFLDQASTVVEALQTRGLMLATVESCTGGMIAAALTAVPGSSAVFDRGFITYANAAKERMVGVPAALLAAHGAVSPEVARAMAEGALRESEAGLSIAVTGIAGPTGGSAEKPVGLVYLACAVTDGPVSVRRQIFAGSRHEIRHATVNAALEMVLRTLEGPHLPPAP